jgi:hypothetical protein
VQLRRRPSQLFELTADLVRQLFEHTPPDDSEMMYVKETLFGAKGGKPNNLWVNIL